MPKKICILAGEESGDVLGGRLIQALKDHVNVSITGVGGRNMDEQGIQSLFPMTDLSVMGIFEVLPRLPLLLKRIKQTTNHIIETQPDIVVTIDSPDFCKRVVKKARKHCPDTKFIHYVAPTVWAWRSGRAKVMAELFDGLICLLPFEPPYFESHGLKAKFCGHPAIENFSSTAQNNDPDMIKDSAILILPGSRHGEIQKMTPIFANVFQRLHQINPHLEGKIVALPHLKDDIEDHFLGMNVTYIDPKMRFKAFKNAPFALATSGTVGLELAIAGCQHIIAYKTNPFTWWLIQRLVKVKYAHLVNIMKDEEIIPECLQNTCTVDHIFETIKHYKNVNLEAISDQLAGEHSNIAPSVQAAQFILEFV